MYITPLKIHNTPVKQNANEHINGNITSKCIGTTISVFIYQNNSNPNISINAPHTISPIAFSSAFFLFCSSVNLHIVEFNSICWHFYQFAALFYNMDNSPYIINVNKLEWRVPSCSIHFNQRVGLNCICYFGNLFIII